MDKEQLLKKLNQLSIWKNGDQRAPHKPLLILYAISELQKSCPRLIKYADARGKLKELLIEFGPLRKSYHPEHPFVRLVNDGVWELSSDINLSGFTRTRSISGG